MTVRRVFLDWNQPALPAAAEYLIERFQAGDSLDLSRVVLVLPGRRAGRRIMELLLQRAMSDWPDWIPPQTVTFQRLPELLYRQQLKLADDLTQLLVWRKALYDVPARELKAALPSVPDKDSTSAWMALCETLRRQHNELAADDMEFDQVATALAGSGHHEEAARWVALRRVQAEYLVQMDSLNLWDRQLARLIAVQQNECVTDRQIVLIGTVDMNQIVRKMLQQIADNVTVLVHAPQSEQDAFDEWGCLNIDAWQDRLLNIPMEISRVVQNPSEQAQTIVAELRQLRGKVRADEITVGVAADALAAPVLQHLTDAGVPGRWAVALELAETRPCRLLASVAQHLASSRDGLPPDFFTLGDLVRHPDVFDWVSGRISSATGEKATDWLSGLDEYLTEHLQTTPGVVLGHRSKAATISALCAAVEELLRCLATEGGSPEKPVSAKAARQLKSAGRQRQLTLDDQALTEDTSIAALLSRRRPLTEWTDGILRLLARVYQSHAFDPHVVADRGAVAGIQAVQQLSATLHSVPDSVVPRCTAGQAIQMILRMLPDDSVPPDDDPQAMDVMGWLDLPLDDADVLLLAGFNEGAVPESVTSDVFLPNSLRTALGINDNRRRYARDAYAITTLLHSRRKLVVIAGRADSQGNPQAPSRLWFAADRQSLPERVRMFYGQTDQSASQVTQSGPATNADSASKLTLSDDGIAGSDLLAGEVSEKIALVGFCVPAPDPRAPAPAEISVTAFRDYLHCPFRYFLKQELRLRSIDDDVRELSAASFGSLLHDVLNRFGDSRVKHSTTPEAIETFLLTELNALATARFGRTRSATVSVQLQMAAARLSEFSVRQAEQASLGWRIHLTEDRLKYPDFTDSKGRPVTLVGRVDRIDRHHKTGNWRVLDYKTGDSATTPERSHQSKGEWTDLQLPLYRLLVRSAEIEGDVELGYVSLPGEASAVRFQIADWDAAMLDSAELRARQIASDIMDLKIDRVAPGEDMRYSELARICQDTVIDRNIPWLADWNGRHQ